MHLFVFCEISLQLFSSFLVSPVISCFSLAYPIVYYFFHNDKRQAFSTLVLRWKFSDVSLWLELGYGLFKGHLRGKVAHSSHHAKGLDYRRDSPWLALSLIAQLKYVYQSLHCEVLIPTPFLFSILYESCNHKECTLDRREVAIYFQVVWQYVSYIIHLRMEDLSFINSYITHYLYKYTLTEFVFIYLCFV